MRKTFILLLMSLMSVLSIQAQNKASVPNNVRISRLEALRVVLNNIETPDSFNFYVSETTSMINPRMRLKLKPFGSNPSSTSQITLLDPYWLVLIDMNPLASWNHSCKYVYVPKNTTNRFNLINECLYQDSICPPNRTMLPGKINVKYQSKAPVKKVSPKPNSSETSNIAAGHTYAVIISGGMTPISNQQRYWNDCSFIYQTLHTTYGVPRNNIKVIMSDGTDTAADMINEDDELVSSPLDLDGDGTDDIQYSATKDNIKTVLDGFKNLGDDDHLFVFVTDHGGYDKAKDKSYICLWNKERLYSTELDSCLNDINAGYITVLLGQCYSGGFVDDLKRTNRTILTACQKNELSYACRDIPYDEFLYKWTSAVNGKDADGNTVDINRDKWGHITFKRASQYAVFNDSYTNGKFKYAVENPSYTYFANSVIEDLSFDSIPNVVDLCFEKHLTQHKIHFQTEIPTAQINPNDTKIIPTRDNSSFWNDDNIWVRNEEAEDTCQDSEIIFLNEKHPYFYVYAKIKNRGVKTYTGKGKGVQYLNGFWARASMFQNRETWFGYYDREDGSIFPGDIIGYNRLTEPIAPGESRIFKKQRYVTDELLSDSILPMCVMGYITGQRYEMKVEVDSLEIIKVWDSDKLVQNNMIKIEDNRFPFTAKILNARNIPASMRVELEREKELSDLLSHTDLSILTNLSGVKSDVNVRPSSGASKLPTFKTVRYKGNTVILPKFDMQPREEGEITVDCSYRADEAITERKTYDVNLVLVDGQSGLRLGGESFRIVQNPRPAILPSVNVISNSSNKATLSVGNVAENARYEWYDKDGNSLGTGSTINVPVSANLSQYKVKVIADKDGAYNYAEANLTGTQSIKNVESGRNETSVAFSEATDCNAKLQLSSVSGSVPTKEYTVAKGIQTYDIPTSELRNGVYQVSLIENGQVIDTKKFVK